MQIESKLERRRKLSFDKNAEHVGGERTVAKLMPIESTEDNWRAWKYLIRVIQQKIKCRGHNANYCVNLLAGIFCTEKISQQDAVRVRTKSGQIHGFTIDFDRLGGLGPKRANQLRLQQRQARQFDPFVEEQNDIPRCRRRRQTAGDQHGQAHRGDQQVGEPFHWRAANTRLVPVDNTISMTLTDILSSCGHSRGICRDVARSALKLGSDDAPGKADPRRR